ncbi:hypothetical protein [Parabacteroides sp. Marseille-P3160]|uniref:hypothetical protein n=1 Tax=Parabacteroides sp. Marseille-P3160 TaxID=1917887 RepID=UPI0009B9F417|nr:hypothetical protein [Parabacteroides sp. Marseille-P3160]
MVGKSNSISFQTGYIVKGEYAVLTVKQNRGTIYPVVNDLLGNGSFMSTPSKKKYYSLENYGITENPVLIFNK